MSKIRKIYQINEVNLLPDPQTGKLIPEEWRDIEGYQDYKVSNYARVMSFKKGWKRILKQSPEAHGYLMVGLYKAENGKSKLYLVHRLLAIAFIPNPENKPNINHKDLKKDNNFILNLEWCTQLENIRHAYSMGIAELTTHKGEDHGNAKLTNDDVLKIRHLYTTSIKSQRKLAKMFGVARNAIRCILYRQTWKHI